MNKQYRLTKRGWIVVQVVVTLGLFGAIVFGNWMEDHVLKVRYCDRLGAYHEPTFEAGSLGAKLFQASSEGVTLCQ